jgi:hypothetical protein
MSEYKPKYTNITDEEIYELNAMARRRLATDPKLGKLIAEQVEDAHSLEEQTSELRRENEGEK